MKKIFYAFLGLFSLLLVSCNNDDDTYWIEPDYSNNALGMIVNTVPDADAYYFYADYNLAGQTGLQYKYYLRNVPFYTGSRNFSVRNEIGSVYDSMNLTLTAGQYFSLYSVKELNSDSVKLVYYDDTTTNPSAGKAKVRFINLSPDTAHLNVSSGENSYATDLAFKANTEFVEINPGTYDFVFADNSTSTTIYTATNQKLEDGYIYTIISSGYMNSENGSNYPFTSGIIIH